MDDNGIRNKVQAIICALGLPDDHPKADASRDQAGFVALELVAEVLIDLKRAATALERIATALESQTFNIARDS